MNRTMSAVVAAAILSSMPAAGFAADPEAGRQFVEDRCAECHAIGSGDDSPMGAAPAFRDVFRNYPPAALEEALAEGIVTGHPAMPEWQLEPQQIADVIAYFETLAAP